MAQSAVTRAHSATAARVVSVAVAVTERPVAPAVVAARVALRAVTAETVASVVPVVRVRRAA